MVSQSSTTRPKRNITQKEYKEKNMMKYHTTVTKTIKKVKKTKNDISPNDKKLNKDLKNFCKVYAKIVEKICNEYIHDTDDHEDTLATAYDKIYEYESGYKIKYIPDDHERIRWGAVWIDYGDIELIVPDNIIISEKEEKKIEEEIVYINSLMIRDFNTILKKSNNKWFAKLCPENEIPKENSILRIKEPFKRISSHVWRLRFELNDDANYCWNPISVIRYSSDMKIKRTKYEFSQYNGDPCPEYLGRDDIYYYEKENNIPKEYMSDPNFYRMKAKGYSCEYAELSTQ